MFKPVILQKYRLVVLRSEVLRALEALQRLNAVELSQFEPNEEQKALLSSYPSTKRGKFASLQLAKLKRIQSFLSQFTPKQSTLTSAKSFLFPSPPKTQHIPSHFNALENLADSEINTLHDEIATLENALKKGSETILDLEEKQKIISQLQQLNIPIDMLYGFHSISILVGKTPKEVLPSIKETVQNLPDVSLLSVTGIEEKLYLISCAVDKEASTMKALQSKGFDRLIIPEHKGTAQEVLQTVKEGIKKETDKQNLLIAKAEHFEFTFGQRLKVLLEGFEGEKYKANAFSLFSRTKKTTVIECFVPKKNALKLHAEMNKATAGKNYVEELHFKDEEAPVLLKNLPGVRNYEYVLEMFGMPSYGSFDPTIIMAFFFPIFFGLAFSDIAYGIMLIALAWFLRVTAGKQSENGKRLSTIALHGGFFTVLFGFVFGGAFGDAFNAGGILASQFTAVFGAPLQAIWANPLTQEGAVGFLLAAIVIGIIQVNLALIIGLIESLSKKQFKKALFKSIVWFILEIGVALLALNVIANFSPEFLYIGGVLFLLSIVLLIKSEGPLGILGVTGFGGNILSYTRLLALGLATGAIALAINIMGGLLMQLPYVGFIVAPLFLIVAHIANFAFNLLGSFIHSLRLHFVEFFGYFFEGGGKKFEPFHFKRVFTTLTEQKGGIQNG